MGVGDFLEFMKTYAVEPAGAGHMREIDLGPARTFVDAETGPTTVVPQRGRVIDVDASQASTTNTAITFGEYTTPTKKIGYAHFEKATDSGGKFRLASRRSRSRTASRSITCRGTRTRCCGCPSRAHVRITDFVKVREGY